MASRYCPACDIRYPVAPEHLKCPIHGAWMTYVPHLEPFEDWHARAQRVRDELVLESEEHELIQTVDGRVTFVRGHYFVSAYDVANSGIYAKLEPGALLRVGHQVFEVEGYRDESRQYWVRPFSMELSAEDLRRLADGD